MIALAIAALMTCASFLPGARAVILYQTGLASANTTAPTGSLAGSGWQYEGQWGLFLGTPIAPRFFLTAKHLGPQNSVFTYDGVTYTIVKSFPDPASDLNLWQVEQNFPAYAPLYSKSDEVGRSLVVIGRGTQRGDEVRVNGVLRGWKWGAFDSQQRWGENVVASVFSNGPENQLLSAIFAASATQNKAHLSVGDSGGAVFVDDGGGWKLAGINYAVDGPFATTASGSDAFDGALFNAQGFYYKIGGSQYALYPGVGTRFYATRVSSKLGWIYSVTDPTGDLDGDGVPNLLEYAFHLDPLKPDAVGLPKVSNADGNLTITYTKVAVATDIVYTVEQSTDLLTWTTAQTQDEVTTANGIQTVKATVAAGSNQGLFLRVKVSRP